MKRKMVSLLLMIGLLISLFPQITSPAFAEILSGTCGAEGDGSNLTWTFDSESGVLTIEGHGAMEDYRYVDDGWGGGLFPDYVTTPWWHYGVRIVNLPVGLTHIGKYAFCGCTGLTNVTIPGSVTSIGKCAFYGCTNLTNVHISDLAAWCSISFEDYSTSSSPFSSNPMVYAHYLCLNDAPITDLVIPDGVKSIGNSAFRGCTGLTSVSIPDSVTSIGSSAFYNCSGLTSVIIGNGVTSVGSSAFYGCSGLTSVIIGNGVTSVGYEAFSGCTGLKNITVPNSVTSIGNGAFNGISKITVETTSIASSWFKNYASLKELVIGAQVRTIGNNAFSGCSSLSKVTMKEGVSTIGDQAFSGCTHLTSLTIPASVTSLGSNVFENCTYLHELQLDVAEISRAALDCCYAQLSDVTITDPECLIEYDANTLGVPGQTVIHGPENSTAQKYADRFGYQFEIYVPKPQITFGDVSETAYYAEPVAWAVDNGITNGTGEGTFSPNNTCTRAQVVTFLWRAKGCPEPTSTENPFADVSGSAYYYKAVLWAKETGVTAGTSADKFSPGNGCTRAQVVTFLWRAEGEPAPISTSNPFTDVAADKYYTNAVLWAVEKEITKGTAADQFSPNATCTRGQIVTFLYRDMEG